MHTQWYLLSPSEQDRSSFSEDLPQGSRHRSALAYASHFFGFRYQQESPRDCFPHQIDVSLVLVLEGYLSAWQPTCRKSLIDHFCKESVESSSSSARLPFPFFRLLLTFVFADGREQRSPPNVSQVKFKMLSAAPQRGCNIIHDRV